MIPDLIVYNYCTNLVHQNEILSYIEELLNELRKNEIDVDFLNLINGNESYPQTHLLINKVLDYWNKDFGELLIRDVYQSFLLLLRFLNNESIENYGHFEFLPPDKWQETSSEIIGLIEERVSPQFYNSIIIR